MTTDDASFMPQVYVDSDFTAYDCFFGKRLHPEKNVFFTLTKQKYFGGYWRDDNKLDEVINQIIQEITSNQGRFFCELEDKPNNWKLLSHNDIFIKNQIKFFLQQKKWNKRSYSKNKKPKVALTTQVPTLNTKSSSGRTKGDSEDDGTLNATNHDSNERKRKYKLFKTDKKVEKVKDKARSTEETEANDTDKDLDRIVRKVVLEVCNERMLPMFTKLADEIFHKSLSVSKMLEKKIDDALSASNMLVEKLDEVTSLVKLVHGQEYLVENIIIPKDCPDKEKFMLPETTRHDISFNRKCLYTIAFV